MIRFYVRLPWLRVPGFMVLLESGTVTGFRWPLNLIFPGAQFRAQIAPLKTEERNRP